MKEIVRCVKRRGKGAGRGEETHLVPDELPDPLDAALELLDLGPEVVLELVRLDELLEHAGAASLCGVPPRVISDGSRAREADRARESRRTASSPPRASSSRISRSCAAQRASLSLRRRSTAPRSSPSRLSPCGACSSSTAAATPAARLAVSACTAAASCPTSACTASSAERSASPSPSPSPSAAAPLPPPPPPSAMSDVPPDRGGVRRGDGGSTRAPRGGVELDGRVQRSRAGGGGESGGCRAAGGGGSRLKSRSKLGAGARRCEEEGEGAE